MRRKLRVFLTSIDPIRREEATANEQRLRGVSRRSAFAVLSFAGVALLVLYPMLHHLYLPLVDLPNHIARFAVMARPEGPLGSYYIVESSLLSPNSAVDVLWQATGMQSDPVAFARITMMVYAVNLLASIMILGRVAVGHWSAWTAVAGLLVYNGCFIWGLQNYVFSVPFSLHALSAWLVMERRPVMLRAAIFAPICVLLFLMHQLAFAVLAVAACGREAQRMLAPGGTLRDKLVSSLTSGIPFALPLIAYAYQTIGSPAGPLGTRTEFGGLASRVRIPLSVQWETPLREFESLTLYGSLSLALLGLCFLTLFFNKGARLQLADVLRGPVIALLILSLFSPAWLNGVALTHIRFPFVTVAVLVAGTSWSDLRPKLGTLLSLMFAVLIAQKALAFERAWAIHNKEMRDLRSVLVELPSGSRILPLRAPGYEQARRLWHVQAYATVYQDAFVPTFFQGTHAVTLKSEWSSFAASAYFPVNAQRVFSPDLKYRPLENAYLANNYWENWDEKFTHVLFLEDTLILPSTRERLQKLKSRGRFSLFKILPPA